MTTFIWIVVFLISITLLIKGSDWLLSRGEKIGFAIGLSPFIIGVTIVSVGTSFPESIVSLVAVFQGITEVGPANAIGSNISNILLVVGFSAILAKKLTVTKSLIDLDLPLLAISTAILFVVAWDGKITFFESLFLVITYIVYILYTIKHREDDYIESDILPSRENRRHKDKQEDELVEDKTAITYHDFLILLAGMIALALGAYYLVESVVALANIYTIGVGVITITAVAIGTSLPELFVSAKAALNNKSEVVLGNIFGSNVFNALLVVGLPGLFSTLYLDEKTLTIGLPALVIVTLLFIISGISRRIHIWEGAFFLIAYALFICKLFELL